MATLSVPSGAAVPEGAASVAAGWDAAGASVMAGASVAAAPSVAAGASPAAVGDAPPEQACKTSEAAIKTTRKISQCLFVFDSAFIVYLLLNAEQGSQIPHNGWARVNKTGSPPNHKVIFGTTGNYTNP
jgi:hypothetical protein